jgi:hypothetical protein
MYPYPQNLADFDALIEKVDAELEAESIPIYLRTLKAVGKISTKLGNIELPLIKLNRPPNPELFDPKEMHCPT